MILRPYGVVMDGRLELGLEVVVEDDGTLTLRPHTAIPEPYVLSAGFANAHSHLEYRGLQDRIGHTEYWPWIRELTRLKRDQDPEDVAADALQAAMENFAGGVRTIEEHSDRPVAGLAIREAGLDAVIYQELITFFEQKSPAEKWAQVESNAEINSSYGTLTHISPHSAFLVDEASLRRFAEARPFSIHVAETPFENGFFREGKGPIADLYRAQGFEPRVTGESVIAYLDRIGLVHNMAQFVHVCAVDDEDIARLTAGGVRVAHCPRSNVRLGCPISPVKRLVDAGLNVGIGLDSAASSGPVDMFAEMREALEQSHQIGEPLLPEEVWRIASIGAPKRQADLIAIHVPDALSTEDLIMRGAPELVG